jgi:hypothetical protein
VLFRSVSVTSESLIKWAEHVFRYMFQSDVAVGAFMPPHQAEQNIPFPMVFRCSGSPQSTRK